MSDRLTDERIARLRMDLGGNPSEDDVESLLYEVEQLRDAIATFGTGKERR